MLYRYCEFQNYRLSKNSLPSFSHRGLKKYCEKQYIFCVVLSIIGEKLLIQCLVLSRSKPWKGNPTLSGPWTLLDSTQDTTVVCILWTIPNLQKLISLILLELRKKATILVFCENHENPWYQRIKRFNEKRETIAKQVYSLC